MIFPIHYSGSPVHFQDVVLLILYRINHHDGEMDHYLLDEFITDSIDEVAYAKSYHEKCMVIQDFGWTNAIREYIQCYGSIRSVREPFETMIWKHLIHMTLIQNTYDDFIRLQNIDLDSIVFRSID